MDWEGSRGEEGNGACGNGDMKKTNEDKGQRGLTLDGRRRDRGFLTRNPFHRNITGSGLVKIKTYKPGNTG